MRAVTWQGRRDVRVEEDPLGVESFASHHLPLEQAPGAYEKFQRRKTGP